MDQDRASQNAVSARRTREAGYLATHATPSLPIELPHRSRCSRLEHLRKPPHSPDAPRAPISLSRTLRRSSA
eukprot:1292618-Rhodomonas_salina.2